MICIKHISLNFEELKEFIKFQMRIEQGRNCQPVMIKTLIQNNGKTSKLKIQQELYKANPKYSEEYFNNSSVFQVLTENHPIAKLDDENKMYILLDYNSFSTAEKHIIVQICNQKIENPSTTVFQENNIDEIASDFREWLKSEKAIKYREIIEKEKHEVKEMVEKLSSLDKKSSEFTELVLYGLLPYFKSKYAKRVSTFPVFMNIKLFLKNYNYSDKEWNLIANMIFSLIEKFQKEPKNLDQWITEFTSDTIHTRMLQSGSITPILFCINDAFPLINNKIIRTYKEFSKLQGWNNNISQKFENYLDGKEKCQKLINFINIDELKDLAVFDLFCWWFDARKSTSKTVNDEDKEGITKIKSKEINFKQFLASIDLEKITKLESHVLRNPERIKIKELLQHCEKGEWQLPNFQRYFDWKKIDIKDLLDSIFNDFYIGSLLLWEINDDTPLKLMPILGVNLPHDEIRKDMIILDGQQRITSLYYAIKGITDTTKNIKKPIYFYIDFQRYLQGHDNNIIILEEKLTREESIKLLHFPFYELENYDRWIDEFEDTIVNENHLKARAIRKILYKKLKHFIDEYEIPYIILPSSVELSQVTDIFEKINTKGKVLGVFDILIATLSKYDIDLRKLWDDAVKNYPIFKEYDSRDKLPIYILQSIALSYHDHSLCGKAELLKMYSTIIEPKNLSFYDIWNEMTEWINIAISKLRNLRDGFGVMDRKSLPYLPVIPILASLLRKIEHRTDTIECESKIKMWYWASVFSEMYSSGVDSQLTIDYKQTVDWFDDENKIVKSVEKARREVQTIDLKNVEIENSARFKGILSLIALEGAPDFYKNRNLENESKNDKHHIFPKKLFKTSENVRSVLNLTWLSEETNRKIVRDKKPSIYFKKLLEEQYNNDKQKFQDMLNSHFINSDALDYMLRDDLTNFIDEREKILLDKITSLINPDTN